LNFIFSIEKIFLAGGIEGAQGWLKDTGGEWRDMVWMVLNVRRKRGLRLFLKNVDLS
jgi:hypothetical protein